MILLIDNYDSFTYNLVQLIGSVIEKKQVKELEKGSSEQNEKLEFKDVIKVIRNDQLTINEIEQLKPSHIIISPGPGKPRDAGICEELILHMKNKAVILGVCLGHQGICEAFGGKITYAKELMHGKRSMVEIDNTTMIFRDLPEQILVGRYHSLAVSSNSLPQELEVIAKASDGEVMAVKHKEYEIYGIQFHPESVLTLEGEKIISNFFII
jgi:anthranilate synthase component 2